MLPRRSKFFHVPIIDEAVERAFELEVSQISECMRRSIDLKVFRGEILKKHYFDIANNVVCGIPGEPFFLLLYPCCV